MASLYTPIVNDGSENVSNNEKIGPDALFNSAIAKKHGEVDFEPSKCADWSKLHIEEGSFGVGQAHYFTEAWLMAARQGDRLAQLLQGKSLRPLSQDQASFHFSAI